MRKPYFKTPLSPEYRPGVGTRTLANEIVTAFLNDLSSEGCDIAAGMFGPKLSALIEELAQLKEKADLFDMLEEALGYDANGTDSLISVTRDEIGIVRIQETRLSDRQVFRSGGKTLLAAARTMALSHPYDEEL